MVSAAKLAGADAVKFQTFSARSLATAQTPKVEYQRRTTDGPNTQLEMLEKLEFKREDHPRIISFCKKLEIEFISTPYDIESAIFLDSLDVACYKVASADIVDLPLHRKIAKTKRPSIVATGMATLEEIKDCLAVYGESRLEQVCLLHCVSNYPCSDGSICLKAMSSLRQNFGTLIGFSDHSVDGFAASLSIGLGACIIEKHFTLDKSLIGPDHQASATPEEFAEMVRAVRRAELVLGDGVKKCQIEESQMRLVSRKSLVLATDLPAGSVISQEHLTLKRPGTGLMAKHTEMVLGKKVLRDLPKDHVLSLDDLQ
jgi:N,N'-diacetyllegionaminate synthase